MPRKSAQLHLEKIKKIARTVLEELDIRPFSRGH
jgi:hypothetical protein